MSLIALRQKIQERLTPLELLSETNSHTSIGEGEIRAYRHSLKLLKEVEDVIVSRLLELEKEQKEEKKHFCIYCKKEMEIGQIDNLGIKWGCYDKECSAVKENNYYYFSLPHSKSSVIISELRFVLGEKP